MIETTNVIETATTNLVATYRTELTNHIENLGGAAFLVPSGSVPRNVIDPVTVLGSESGLCLVWHDDPAMIETLAAFPEACCVDRDFSAAA